MTTRATTAVFLSYARGDDEPFVGRLYRDLCAAGFDVWFDRVTMPNRGLAFTDEIRRAIRAQDRFVLVLGPHAAASSYVRDEWAAALALDKPVHPVVRLGDAALLPEPVGIYDARFMQRDADYEQELTRLIEQLQAPPPALGALHGVPSLPPHYLERPEVFRELRDVLRSQLERRALITSASARVGLQGMGGIGKSVLASALARDTRVRSLFPDGVYWVTIGQDPKLVELQRALATALGDVGDFDSLIAGRARLHARFRQKQALLVLDDVWHKRDTDAFDVLGPMGHVIVTTRDAQLVTSIGGVRYQAQLLSIDEARRLLAQWSGTPLEELPTVASELLGHCAGLPLAVAICGAMIRDGRTWSDVVSDLRAAELEFVRHDLPAYPHENVWKAIKIGIDVLSDVKFGGRPDYRERFAELAIFSPDEPFTESAVATLWSHTGGMSEVRSRDLLRQLASKALVQLSGADDAGTHRVRLHDLVHDFARRMVADPRRLHENLLEAYRIQYPAGWWSADDGYLFAHLRTHLLEANQPEELIALMLDFRWLDAKSRAGLTFDLLADFSAGKDAAPENDARRDTLRLLEEAVRQDIHFVVRRASAYPQALFQCLWNSLSWAEPEHDARPERTAWLARLLGAQTTASSAETNGARLAARRLVNEWRLWRETAVSGFAWLRSLRPPPTPAGGAQRAVFWGHEKPIRCLSLSTDGARLASGADDGTLRVWDTSNGVELLCLRAEARTVDAVAFSPDGNEIVSARKYDRLIIVWDSRVGTKLRSLMGHTRRVTNVDYSTDGQLILSAGEDKSIRIWDARTGELRFVMTGHRSKVKRALFVPGRHWVISAGDGTWHDNDASVRLWDADTGRELRCLLEDPAFARIEDLQVSSDASRVALAGGNADGSFVVIYDLSSGRKALQIDVQWVTRGGLAFSNDGTKLAWASHHYGSVHIWSAASGKELARHKGHTEQLVTGDNESNFRVLFSPDDRFVYSTGDTTIRQWRVEATEATLDSSGHDDQIRGIALSSDGILAATTSYDRTVRVWSCLNGEPLLKLTIPSGTEGDFGPSTVLFGPDGDRLYAVVAGTIRVWGFDTGSVLHDFRGRVDQLLADTIALSGNGCTIVSWGGAVGRWVYVWDVHSRQLVHTIGGRAEGIDVQDNVVVSQDGQLVAFGSDVTQRADGLFAPYDEHKHRIRVMSTRDASLTAELKGHQRAITGLCMSADGRTLVSGSLDGTVRVWDVREGTERMCLQGTNGPVRVALSNDGRTILASEQSEKRVSCVTKVWDALTGQLLRSLDGVNRLGTAAASGERGTLAIAASVRGNETCLMDMNTGLAIAFFPARLNALQSDPVGRVWAGKVGNQLYLLRLEGCRAE